MTQNSAYQQELEQKRQHWCEHTNSWQDSGLSQTEYCRRHKLVYHRFIYWRERYAPKPATAISIVEVPPPTVEMATHSKSWPSALRVSLGQDLSVSTFCTASIHTHFSRSYSR